MRYCTYPHLKASHLLQVDTFCPEHLFTTARAASTHITGVAFSQRGELLVTYSDNDIFLFHPSLRGRTHAHDVRTRSYVFMLSRVIRLSTAVLPGVCFVQLVAFAGCIYHLAPIVVYSKDCC